MTSNRNIFWSLILLVAPLLSQCAKEEVVIPEVIEDEDTAKVISVVDITPYGATIRGKFGEGADSSTISGVRYSLQNTKYITTTGDYLAAKYIGNGISEVTIEGLYSDTTYYFSTNVEKDQLIHNSQIYQFRTKRLTARTDSAINVYSFGAQLGLTLSEDIDPKKFKGTYGIYYSTRQMVIREQSTLCDSSFTVRGLRSDVTYYFRAFVLMKTASLREVYLWGDVQSFHTPNVGVQTLDADEVNTYSAKLTGYVNVMFSDVEDMGLLLFERNRNVTLDSVGVASDQKIEKLSPTELDERQMGNFSVSPKGLKSDKKYYFRSYAKINETVGNQKKLVTYYGDVKDFKTLQISISTGDEVDLGLSVIWATKNYGAKSISDIGTSISNEDADAINFGGWRLPTQAEAQELIDECNWSWSTYDDANGAQVVNSEGKAIFMPANMAIGSTYTYGIYMLKSEASKQGYLKSIAFVQDSFNANQCGKSANNEVTATAPIAVRLVKDK